MAWPGAAGLGPVRVRDSGPGMQQAAAARRRPALERVQEPGWGCDRPVSHPACGPRVGRGGRAEAEGRCLPTPHRSVCPARLCRSRAPLPVPVSLPRQLQAARQDAAGARGAPPESPEPFPGVCRSAAGGRKRRPGAAFGGGVPEGSVEGAGLQRAGGEARVRAAGAPPTAPRPRLWQAQVPGRRRARPQRAGCRCRCPVSGVRSRPQVSGGTEGHGLAVVVRGSPGKVAAGQWERCGRCARGAWERTSGRGPPGTRPGRPAGGRAGASVLGYTLRPPVAWPRAPRVSAGDPATGAPRGCATAAALSTTARTHVGGAVGASLAPDLPGSAGGGFRVPAPGAGRGAEGGPCLTPSPGPRLLVADGPPPPGEHPGAGARRGARGHAGGSHDSSVFSVLSFLARGIGERQAWRLSKQSPRLLEDYLIACSIGTTEMQCF